MPSCSGSTRWFAGSTPRTGDSSAPPSNRCRSPRPACPGAVGRGCVEMAVLELREVCKTYGDGANEVRALDTVDLTVAAGQLVAVMGPSGSGKSTLLTIAGSLEDPTSGDARVGGAALAGLSADAKARLRRRLIGYVFQDYNLLAGLTAAENVAMPLELDGIPARRAHDT